MWPKTQELIWDVINNEGVNIQIIGTQPPTNKEKQITLYLIDEKAGTKKFKVDVNLAMLLDKKTDSLAFGTTKENGDKTGVVMIWEE